MSIYSEVIKDTSTKVLVTLISAGVLTVLAALYTKKNQYFEIILDFFVRYWVHMMVLLAFIATWIYFLLQLNKLTQLSKVKSVIQTHAPLTAAGSSIPDIKKRLDSLETRANSLEGEVYRLRRADLYQEARKHQELGQQGALLCRLEVIELDIENNTKYLLEESLAELFGYVKYAKAFSVQNLSEVKNRLSKIQNDGNKEIVDQIVSEIKSKVVASQR